MAYLRQHLDPTPVLGDAVQLDNVVFIDADRLDDVTFYWGGGDDRFIILLVPTATL